MKRHLKRYSNTINVKVKRPIRSILYVADISIQIQPMLRLNPEKLYGLADVAYIQIQPMLRLNAFEETSWRRMSRIQIQPMLRLNVKF